MDILDVVIWFCIGLTIVFAVIIAYKAIRTRIIAGRAGILKVCVSRVSLILEVATCALFLFVGIGRMNDAERYFRAARANEALLDSWDKITGSGYQQAAIKTDTVSPESITKIRNSVQEYRETGGALRLYAIVLFALSFSDLASMATSFWYITEGGVVFGNFKMPEPIYAVLNGNKIDINYMAQLVNVKKLQSFKATPKNLAVFGRFMKWEQEQSPQNVPVLQSPQAPQYPQYPTYPQAPPQSQIPLNPQDVNIPNDKEQL